MTAHLAVLGAGPTGLMTALLAAEAGFDVTIFESAPQVGGMAASVEVAGQRVDLGSHRLHPTTDAADLALVERLLGDDLQTRERNGRIHLEGRWLGFPLQTGDMIRSLPFSFSARAAFDAAIGPFRRIDDRSFERRVSSTLGPTVSDRFYTPYARKLYGLDPTKLDADLARRRISATGAGAILKRLVKARTSTGRAFLYPRRGYGQIAEAIADAAQQAGAELRLDEPVTSLHVTGRGVTVGTAAGTTDVAHVISTIPVGVVSQILEPAPPEPVHTAVSRLRTRGMVLVYLEVPRPQYTEFDAHYIPDEHLRVARLSECKNYRTSADDPADRTILCAEIACWPGDETWSMNDDALGELVASELRGLGLPDPEQASTTVLRLPSVYPSYELATVDERTTVDAWAASLEAVTVVGRQGLWVPDNLHHVFAMARGIIAALNADGSRNQVRWTESLRSFADHVVED